MKKTVIIALCLLSLVSCKKSYTCDCTNQTTGSKAASYTDDDKKKVEDYCRNIKLNPPYYSTGDITTCEFKSKNR